MGSPKTSFSPVFAANAQATPATPRVDDTVTAMAHESIYDTVLSILKTVRAGKVLDVPAGEGALALRLANAGFDVRCCDLYPEIFRLKNIEIRKGNLEGCLDYANSSFDSIVCVEGLEHAENPQNAIREFARLLREGGNLIVSVPNILNVEERLKWLLHGYTSHFKPLSAEHLAKARTSFGDRLEITLHVNPIGYSELRYTLEKYGFELVKVYRDKPKSRAWLYWPLVALIRFVGKLNNAQKRRERWSDQLQSDEVLMGGNTLIVHAVRRSPMTDK